MLSSRDHGSGTIIITACGSSRPESVSSSRTLSNIAESDPSVSTTVRNLHRILAEEARAHHRLARVHPVDVAAQRVDLAVVRDVAVGVRAPPGGEGVGGEARVHHRDRGDDGGILKVEEEAAQLPRVEHSLVDDGLVAEAGDVEVAASGNGGARHLLLHQPADDVELALQRLLVGDSLAAADEDLADHRLARLGGGAEGGVVGGNVAPADQLLAFGAHRLLEEPVDRVPAVLARGQEDHARAVAAALRQREAELLAFAPEERVRRLEEDPGAVPRVLLRSGGAAVLQVEEHLQRLQHDVVRGASLDVGHESEAAGIVLQRRIVEPLLGRRSCVCHLLLHLRWGCRLRPVIEIGRVHKASSLLRCVSNRPSGAPERCPVRVRRDARRATAVAGATRARRRENP